MQAFKIVDTRLSAFSSRRGLLSPASLLRLH